MAAGPGKGLFYTVPFQKKNWRGRALWMDEKNILRAIANQAEKKKLSSRWGPLYPSRFSGLAVFHKNIFKFLTPQSFHIFDDVLKSRLFEGCFKVFLDKEGLALEGGEFTSYLSGTEKVLRALFSKRDTFLKQYLEDVFFRFDPKDCFIGLKKGRKMEAQFQMRLLCPNSVKGLEFFSGKGFAVLGPNVCFSGKSFLKNTVLGPFCKLERSFERQVAYFTAFLPGGLCYPGDQALVSHFPKHESRKPKFLKISP